MVRGLFLTFSLARKAEVVRFCSGDPHRIIAFLLLIQLIHMRENAEVNHLHNIITDCHSKPLALALFQYERNLPFGQHSR